MKNKLIALWRTKQTWFRNAWLLIAGIAAVHYGAVVPSQDFRGIAQSKETALGAVEDNRHWHWYQSLPASQNYYEEGIIGGVPGGAPMMQTGERLSDDDQRKIVRTSSISLLVEKPAEAAKTIQHLAENAGGFLVSWAASGGQEATSASLTVRVPVTKYEATRASILKLGQRVENEQLQAEDVSRKYVDDGARLRNLRAQETQYLAILKMARTVKDTLEVSEKLNQVRGEIEQHQSEFNALSKQVDLVAIYVSLRKEPEAQIFGLPWRPAYELKFAARQGLEGLIDYSTSIMSFIFYLPAIVLWLGTILGGTFVFWRILRRTARLLFASAKAPVVTS